MRRRIRKYRELFDTTGRIGFRVVVKETDLYITADSDLSAETRELTLTCRRQIESYIEQHPSFASAMSPWLPPGPAPGIINRMAEAGRAAGVGPMAAVAGAVAEQIGLSLLKDTRSVMVENGGDIFIKTDACVTIGIFAGRSPLSMRIGMKLPARRNPFGVCTSSGTIGHSVSLGKADAVCVLSENCALADAAATAIGNRVRQTADIEKAIAFGRMIPEAEGIVIVKKDKIGAWGNVEIVPLDKQISRPPKVENSI